LEFSDEDKEIGRKLFLGDCQFIKSCVSLDTLPSQNNSEVAFFGRSNVGKSSLINSLTNKKKLAKFSKTPGRTRQLNFFKIENKSHSLNFVDLPGYGFAKVSKIEQREWRNLIFDYISTRQNLRTILLLMEKKSNKHIRKSKLS
jgi:GTP-binding protein